jgi:hypothetical protein
MKRYIAFKAYFRGPTNTLGSRVIVKREGSRLRSTLPYDYAVGGVLDQAEQYLRSEGFNPFGVVEEKDHYLLLIDPREEGLSDRPQ